MTALFDVYKDKNQIVLEIQNFDSKNLLRIFMTSSSNDNAAAAII